MSAMPTCQCDQAASSSNSAIPIPQRRFSHVHVDLVGPLPFSSDSFSYILTMIDRTTRWLEAVPLKEMTASTCTAAFMSSWAARFGVPTTLTSDRGTQFSSATWQQLCARLGIQHIMTTSYHPQANGMVKRVHRQLKDTLRAREAGAEWPEYMPPLKSHQVFLQPS